MRTTVISCALGRERRLSSLVDGEIDAAEARELRAHVARCGRCAAMLAELGRVAALVGALSVEVETPAPVPDWVHALPAQPSRALPPRSQRTMALRVGLATAALAIIAGAVWLAMRTRPVAWEVATLDGTPLVADRSLAGSGRLGPGDVLVTDGRSRALVSRGGLGTVTVEPGSRVRLEEAVDGRHRFSLDRGRLEAEITAPARAFSIDTPSATAVDLGCAFALDVDDAGVSTLHVTSGWVALERDGVASYVPAGTVCRSRPGVGPGTPFLEESSDAFKSALERYDFDGRSAAALDDVMNAARLRDSLTLVSLLPRAPADKRTALYYSIATYVPAPEGVTRDGVVALDPEMLARWRRDCEYVAVGVDPRRIPRVAGHVEEVGALGVGRRGHTATLVRGGRVLVAGGMAEDRFDYAPPFLADAELYDPGTRSFRRAPPMTVPRAWHTATPLGDGHVLLVGGAPTAEAEIYDAAKNIFTKTGALAANRRFHTATLLADGRVLVAGGDDANGDALATAEIFDPKTGRFSPTGSMSVARRQHTATLLADGRVLVAGGALRGPFPSKAWASAEIYDPETGRFAPAGDMAIPHAQHAALRLADGRVLVVGGVFGELPDGVHPIAELFDPATSAFTRLPDMGTAHLKMQNAVALLDDGRVAVAGGGPLLEVFDPASGLFATLETGAATARYYATATRLDDGSVLIAGGSGSGVARRTDVWVFRPDPK